MRSRFLLTSLIVLVLFGMVTLLPVTSVTALAPTKTPKPTDSAPTPTSVKLDTSWLRVYFTNPNPPDQVGKGIDNIVVPVINAAKRSIDVTSFDLNLPSFVNALVAAQQRGVKVRVVVDDKNGTQVLRAGESADGTELDAAKTLSTAGITVVGGGRSNGLMHDKIIIVDGVILFMGSWNMSYNDTFRNNNNMLVITSQRLIDNYEAKFNELFVDQKFGAKAKVGAQNPQVTINNVEVDNYFSPVDKVMDKIVTEVNKAQKSVKFMAFTYTDARLSGAMIAQFKKGIKVQGVIENRGASQGALPALFCAKVPVETDGNKYTMHHKVIIIDDQVVITGSFNFTNSADTANDDNILIIRNASVAALYTQEFDRIYAQGNTPTSVTCN